VKGEDRSINSFNDKDIKMKTKLKEIAEKISNKTKVPVWVVLAAWQLVVLW